MPSKQVQLILIARNSWLRIYAVNVQTDITLDQMDSAKKLILFVILMKHQQEYVLLASPDSLYPMEDALFQTMISLTKTVKLGKVRFAFNAHKAPSSVLMGNAR